MLLQAKTGTETLTFNISYKLGSYEYTVASLIAGEQNSALTVPTRKLDKCT